MSVPNHIAIIMDGNGRWAKSKNMPRNYGHTMGAKNVENICRLSKNMGVRYLTLYAFSTENWKRPEAEVKALMLLFDTYLDTCLKKCRDNNMSIRIIGDKQGLSEKLKNKMEYVERESSIYDEFTLILAINYGSRDEILRAIKNVSLDVKNDKLNPDEINEQLFSTYLDTRDIPDPDLMIRTSGELRLSNYLLWQLAYSEFYFTEKAWPEFDEAELKKAIDVYNNRDRRFGKLQEE